MNATPVAAEQHRVLVVADEPNIVDVVSIALRFQGFAVESAGTGRDALAAVRSFDPHLMVLDVARGEEDDRHLRALRAEALGDLEALHVGSTGLVARIRVIMRRTGAASPSSSRLTFEDLELDEDTRDVTRAGEPIELTATEYRLLRYLLLNPRVLTRAQLLDHVWEYDFDGDSRILETGSRSSRASSPRTAGARRRRPTRTVAARASRSCCRCTAERGLRQRRARARHGDASASAYD